MGTLSQILHFINSEKLPDANFRMSRYSHFTPDDNDTRIRKEYRKNITQIIEDKENKNKFSIKDIFG